MNQVAVVETDAVVATMHRARLALSEAKTIQETKRIVDAAAAAEIYAKRQKLGEETSDLALSIKVEALRKLGEMLVETPLSKGEILRGSVLVPRENPRGSQSEPREDPPLTLADLGLTKKESAVAQKLAALPESEYQQVRDGHVTVAKAIAAVDVAKKQPKPAQAPPPEAPDETAELRERLAEQASQFEETLAENIAMSKVVEADDKLAEAMAQIKQLTAENLKLRERINGLTNEASEAKKLVKFWKNKAEKAERAAA